MSCTRYSIAEQVSLKLYGGAPKVSSPVQMSDIMLAVGQACNILLKTQHFASMTLGENAPENLMIATYPKVPLTTWGGKRARCTLPAMPVSLIRNLGVWQVSTSEFFECLLIPIMSGQFDLLRGQDVISDLLGQTGYEVDGMQLTTTKDLTIDNIDGLYIRLLITDISTLSDYAPLPIPADMEGLVIDTVYKSFAPIPSPVRLVDNYAANPQS
jgi:hypothetical protein